MTLAPKPLYTGGQAPATATVIYTAPTATKAIITSAVFTNTDTVNRTLTIYIVRGAGSAGNANVLIDAQSLTPGQAYVSSELWGQTLNAGDTLQWLADAGGKITCAGINGFEST